MNEIEKAVAVLCRMKEEDSKIILDYVNWAHDQGFTKGYEEGHKEGYDEAHRDRDLDESG